MNLLLAAISLVSLSLFAGCGSGGNSAGVTPVIGNTVGSYRLASIRLQIERGGATSSFLSYSSGVLRLFSDGTYRREMAGVGGKNSSYGGYAIGRQGSNILASKEGAFLLTPFTDIAHPLTGNYLVTPDFILTLDYNGSTLPDQALLTRSETWVKESDYPWQ